MPWFPVDDSFHSHPKALATSLAARGLWATAGSWSSAHLTDGVVPVHVLASLGGTPELAAELVAAGLWRRTRQGYVFHDWLEWGSKRTADEIRELRKVRAENGRKGGLASGKARSNGQAKPKQVASRLPRDSLNPSPDPSSVVYVGDQSSRRNARDDPVIDEIIKAIYATTGRVIDADWAAKIAGHILGNHHAANPAAYVRKVIENDPDPRTRFLEH